MAVMIIIVYWKLLLITNSFTDRIIEYFEAAVLIMKI